ncbi:MAG TPA: histidine phosphatase family protein [Steroidobacteraceae bacterium]
MELLVVRHAIAFERNTRRWPDDGERPLSPQGMARASKAAQGLKRITEHPLRVLVSPLRRAQQTASILTQFAGWPAAAQCVQLLPGASPDGLLVLLARTQGGRMAVVGHQPGLGRLIAACLPGGVGAAAFELRKMGVALLSFQGAARAGRGELIWLLPPRILRAAR